MRTMRGVGGDRDDGEKASLRRLRSMRVRAGSGATVLAFMVLASLFAAPASAAITDGGAFGIYQALTDARACGCPYDSHQVDRREELGPGGFTFNNPQSPLAAAHASDPGHATADASVSEHANAAVAVGADWRFTANIAMDESARIDLVDPSQPVPAAAADAFYHFGVSGNFSTTEPVAYDFTGSTSGAGTASFQLTRTSGQNPGQVFRSANGQVGGAPQGTIPPGSYSYGVEAELPTSAPNPGQAMHSDGATFSLTVHPLACQGGATEVTVGNAVAQGCLTERKDAQGRGTGVFETDQPAWVGGFPLEPRGGGKLVVAPGNQASPLQAEGAGVDLVLGDRVRVPAPLDELKPFLPSYTVGVNTAGSFGRFAALPLLQGASAQAKVSWSPGGKGAKVEAQVSMEDMTKNIGEAFARTAGISVGTLSGKLTLALANGQAADITQGELQIPEIAVQLKDTDPPLKMGLGGGRFKAQKVNGKIEWSAEVTVLFPWRNDSGGRNQGSVTGRLFYTDGQLGGLGLAVSGFEEPIGETGWDLTGVDGNLIMSPALAFDFGITAQQRSVFAGVKLFKMTGNVKGLRLARTDCRNGSNPFEFVGTANIPPLEQRRIGTGKLQLTMCAYVPSAAGFAFEVGATVDLTLDAPGITKLFAAKGSVTGWFQGAASRSSALRTNFNLDGNFLLTIPVIGAIGATGVLSSEGYAICAQYGSISTGVATHNWVDPPTDLTGCDFTPYRVATPAAAAAARAVRVPAGQAEFAIAVGGSGTAPRVRVLGPHGKRFLTPAGATPLKTKAAIIVPIDQLHTTYVFLHRPAAGRWRIQPLPGSAPITRLRTATQLPRPRIRASVKLKGGRATLRWRARRIRGQRIQLVDRAPGLATILQRPTARAGGTIRFTPANRLATRRTIEALVLENGAPRARLVIAHYRLKRPARPGRVTHTKATRGASGLTVTWRRATGAHDYLVTVTQGTSVLTRTTTPRTKLTLTGAPTGALTIRIEARDAFERSGRAITLRTA